MLLSLCCSVVIMLYCYCVALLLVVLSYVLIVCTVPMPPGVNPIAVDKHIYLYLSIKWFRERGLVSRLYVTCQSCNVVNASGKSIEVKLYIHVTVHRNRFLFK